MRLNRDAFAAIALLFMCGVFFYATLDLRPPISGQLSSALWPRIILAPLAFLSFGLLIQSQRKANADAPHIGKLGQWLRDNINPIICFVLFFLFIFTMPIFGMLIGGLGYVFLTLCVLGGWERRRLFLHAAITSVFVVGMWALFTQGLGVFLPEGQIFRLL